MANFNLNAKSAISYFDSVKLFQGSTPTQSVSPEFSSVANNPYTPKDFGNLIIGMGNPYSFNTPRRPAGGQLYPRGNQ